MLDLDIWLITATEIVSVGMGYLHLLSVNSGNVFIDFTVGRRLALNTFILEMRKMGFRDVKILI